MSEQTVAGIVLIATPVLFNVGFTLLAQRFDYPDILRRPTSEVLERVPPSVGPAHPSPNPGGEHGPLVASAPMG